MSVLYAIVPLDTGDESIVSWLRSMGVAVPVDDGRYATLLELRAALDQLSNYVVRYNTGQRHWDADITSSTGDERDWAFLVVTDFNGEEDKPYSFYFKPGSPKAMLNVLR